MDRVIIAFVAVLCYVPLMLVLAIPGGWAFMLLMGTLHAEVAAGVPAIGFAAAYPIMLFAGWTLAFVAPTSSGSAD